MADNTPDAISRYFAADARRDTETIVALFTEDGVVVDEDQIWQERSGIRAWREGPASAFHYTTELLHVETADSGDYLARVRLTGNFPGGTVVLTHRFSMDGDRIRRLEIAP